MHTWKSFVSRALFLVSCLLLAVVLCKSAENEHTGKFLLIEEPQEVYTSSSRIIYFGRETCPSCGEALRYLLKILPDGTLDVYYFNTDTFREYPEFQQILDDFCVTEVPLLVKAKDGRFAENLSMVSENGALEKEDIRLFLSQF